MTRFLLDPTVRKTHRRKLLHVLFKWGVWGVIVE